MRRLDQARFDLLTRRAGSRYPEWFQERVRAQLQAHYALDTVAVGTRSTLAWTYLQTLACMLVADAVVGGVTWTRILVALLVALGLVLLMEGMKWAIQESILARRLFRRYTEEAEEVRLSLTHHERLALAAHAQDSPRSAPACL